jgi:hypothetical protein
MFVPSPLKALYPANTTLPRGFGPLRVDVIGREGGSAVFSCAKAVLFWLLSHAGESARSAAPLQLLAVPNFRYIM